MVTDGQIPNPSQQLLDRIAAARGELGLEVHGLIVGDKTQVCWSLPINKLRDRRAVRTFGRTCLRSKFAFCSIAPEGTT